MLPVALITICRGWGSLEYLRENSSKGHPNSLLDATFREKWAAHLSISETLQCTNRQRSVAFGGSLISRKFNLSVDYQTIYVPFAVPGRPEFQRALVLNLRAVLPRDVEVHVDTNITPLGAVRYTTYANGFASRGNSLLAPGSQTRAELGRFVVRGRVVDTAGAPVYGAALRVGDELAFTDSNGIFLLRFKKPQMRSFRVELSEFLLFDTYKVTSAPTQVHAQAEDSAPTIQVVLQRT